VGSKIKVVIADDHKLLREMLHLALRQEKSIDIVGEAANGLQAIDVISDLKPDVVLLDIIMPKMDGLKVLPAIREKSPKTKALMLTVADDEVMILKALKAGAKGYLLKDVGISDLIMAIKAVHQGELWVARKRMARFFEEEAIADPKGEDRPGKTKEGLTQREYEVLRLLTKGSTNKEISKALFISEKTVKSHLNSIFRKLKVSRRLQAILYAIKRGLS
jgi:DNA-binding NarL/FixJ family response regulator